MKECVFVICAAIVGVAWMYFEYLTDKNIIDKMK